MVYAVGLLLLLIVACSLLLMRIERFDNPVPKSKPSSGGTEAFTSRTSAAGSPPTNTVPTGAASTSSSPASATITNPAGTPLTSQDGTTDTPKATVTAADIPKATTSVPSPSDGSTSRPSDLSTNLANILGLTSLQQGDSFNATTAPQSFPSQDGSRIISGLQDMVTTQQQQISDLKKQNTYLSDASNVCPPPPPKKRCPDMSQYIRKDSIPCYNCSL